MPHKFNASRRHKFAKKRYRVANWSSYNESLRQRGDVTVWLSPEVEDDWRAERRKTRGGQLVYSDLAITVCLTLGMVYKQPLRRTEGLVRGLLRLMKLDLPVPGFSILSRRGAGLSLLEKSKVQRDGPVHLVVDSTGLKIFGEGEWLQNKHKTKAKCRSWRKLHLGLDLVSGDIVCSDLTNDDVGDTTALPDLLEQIDADVAQFIADGAYDGDPTSNLLVERFGVGVEIIIPPPKNAVPSPTAAHDPSLRDQRIAAIRTGGQQRYSDLAIEMCLTLRVVFGLPLRQTQGFVRSLLRLMKLDLPVPDYSTLWRRAQTLLIVSDIRMAGGPITLVVDSTGLRVHGGRDWMREKHGLPKARRTWRKLHIGFDLESGVLVASRLTTEHVGDPGALPDLLAEVAGPVHRFIADGAYDGTPTAATIRQAFGTDVELIIPPPKNAVPGECAARNAHIDMIAKGGRMAWQKATGYGQISRGEAQIGRYKQVNVSELRSRKLETQTTETKIVVKALNRMTHLGRATYERVA